jgi:hypothetical protein
MNTAWMDGQFVLDFYQACLTLLVWLLATFACLGVLASGLLLCLECSSSTGSASLASKRHCDIGAQGAKRVVRFASPPPFLFPVAAPHASIRRQYAQIPSAGPTGARLEESNRRSPFRTTGVVGYPALRDRAHAAEAMILRSSSVIV